MRIIAITSAVLIFCGILAGVVASGEFDNSIALNEEGSDNNISPLLNTHTPPQGVVFDTGAGTYPSIMGTHDGTLRLDYTFEISRMYTYPCAGTGGHTEYVAFYSPNGTEVANGSWSSYRGPGDYHYINFSTPFILEAGVLYNYTIITGSYPQIHHNQSITTENGTITCIRFIDANGKKYDNWIPAIRLEGEIKKEEVELEIALKSRRFVPSPGIDEEFVKELTVTPLPNLHAIVQLKHLPTVEEMKVLEAKGVRLSSYLHGQAYFASVSKELDPEDEELLSLVRWMGKMLPEDKVDPKIIAGDFYEWALNPDDTVNLLVMLFKEVNTEEVLVILEKHGAISAEPYGPLNDWAVVLAKGEIEALSQEDRVKWIEEGPIPFLPVNDIARTRLDVNEVQDAEISGSTIIYQGLDGTGVRVAVCDTGVNSSHPDFSGRIIRDSGAGSHGTHVGGIVGASGFRSEAEGGTPYQWRGMAPKVLIASFPGLSSSTSGFDEAINDYLVDVTTHSYVMTYGSYSQTAADIDEIVRGDASYSGRAIPACPAVWAACNQGIYIRDTDGDGIPDSPQYDNEEGYFSIYSPAKNTICVGALTRSANYDLRDFSSRGPTFDQRIKPDVMAIGCINSTNSSSYGYVMKCGTSMATPCVTGTIALMMEQFHLTFGDIHPLPSTFKAILIQTATDLIHNETAPPYGWNDLDTGEPVIYHAGPDYSTGYGVINAQRAVRAVRAKNFVEGTVSPADTTDTYEITVLPGRDELKFTLAWDDEPGDTNTAETTSKLVNDLDLVLIDPVGNKHLPWVLDPLPCTANPGDGNFDPIDRGDNVTPAYRGEDHRNNVEQVQVDNPIGGTWTVKVNASALPLNNPQNYSLAGEFRRLEIVDPVQGAAADAGDPNDPDKIMVVLIAKNPYQPFYAALTDAEPDDFGVKIGTDDANIISGLPVGDQFWLVVQAPVQSGGAGYYDLEVTWKGISKDKENNSVRYLPKARVDRVVVVDRSGSMAYADKMPSAKNAGRLFVDQSSVGDRIGVVAFTTNATVNYTLTNVTGNVELNGAKNALDSLTPDAWTALGKGLLTGQDQLENYGKADDDWVMVLLSDGMENVEPYWDTPEVRGIIEPSKTIVHTVAVGPPEAGHHTLLQDIATKTHGTFYCTETHSPGPEVFPVTLANRLADIYKSIEEDIAHQQRMWEKRGELDLEHPLVGYEVNVEKDLPEAVFTVNWDNPSAYIKLNLRRPDGSSVSPTDGDVVAYRDDKTHMQFVMKEPEAGWWVVTLETFKDQAEYITFLSGKSKSTMQVFFGAPPKERVVGVRIPILAILADSKPILRANVVASIKGPDKDLDVAELPLYDDGKHGDGAAYDGIYGNYYTKTWKAGSYGVKVRGTGTNNYGEDFERYVTRPFYIRPKITYVYSNLTTANSYQSLLEDNGVHTTLIPMSKVSIASFSPYQLIIIGPETGHLSNWGDEASVSAIVQSEKPIIGLGEGGYAFFGKLNLAIGYPYGWHGSEMRIYVVDPTQPVIYETPYPISIPRDGILTLYTSTGHVGINLPKPPSDVVLIGREPDDATHYPIVQEKGRYLLWGFDDSPTAMTQTGKQLFTNSAWYMS